MAAADLSPERIENTARTLDACGVPTLGMRKLIAEAVLRADTEWREREVATGNIRKGIAANIPPTVLDLIAAERERVRDQALAAIADTDKQQQRGTQAEYEDGFMDGWHEGCDVVRAEFLRRIGEGEPE